MDVQELLLIAFRASLVYLFLLLVIRLLGKREVGSFSAFDFIVALILGEAVDEAIYGDVTMLKFIVLVITIAAWHFFNAWLTYRSRTMEKILEASPSILVKNGKMQPEALAKERINEEDVFSQLRLQSIDDLKEVKKATLEPNGQISVIKEDWARELQKSDLPARQKSVKKAA